MSSNKVILNKMSEIDIAISDPQYQIIIDKFQKIKYLESKLENNGLEISPNVLSISLLEYEVVDSSIIEGTQTNYNEIYFDIAEGIRDKYSWEVRNLINLYKSVFRDFNDGVLDYATDDLKAMHRALFFREIKDYENLFDPIEIIKKVKPGKIITDDKSPNWIGPRSKSIEHASLIPIKPSLKNEYLEDLFKVIRNNKNKKNVKVLIKFHPLFEAIHPFADGNGRLGRLLLVNLFNYLGFSTYNWIFISNYWRKNKSEYMSALKNVQTTNNWNNWTYFFIKSLMHAVDDSYDKLNSLLELYNKYRPLLDDEKEVHVLNYFFKYNILHKAKTISHLKEKYKIPSTTAYRVFNKIAQTIKASGNSYYKFNEAIEILSR